MPDYDYFRSILSDLGAEVRALQHSIMLKLSEGITAEISKDIIQNSLLSVARRAKADFRSSKVYKDLALKV
jgi:hypothetical protein